jgi:hypothetical protein
MSTKSMSSPAQAANAFQNTPEPSPGEAPGLQDLIAEKTLSMIGGAPKEELQRVGNMAQAQLGNGPEADTGGTSDGPAPAALGADGSADQPGGDDTNNGPEASSADGAAEPSAQKDPERFRFQQAEDRAVAQIAKAKGISLVDAARIYAGEPAPAVVGPAPVGPGVAQLEAQIGELERRLDASSATEALWNPQIAALVKEHSKAAAALQVARLTEQQAAEGNQAFEAQRHATLADTVKQYPDLGNRDSVLWKVAAQMAREAHDPRHPDHEAGQTVEAPRYFADKAAVLLKMKPAGAAGAAASSGKVGGAAAWSARPGPASGSRQTLPLPPEASAQQRVANAQARTLAMIGGHSGLSADDDSPPVLVL